MPQPLHVLYSDNHLLVVAKPAGLPIVPDRSGDESLLDLSRRWVEETFHKRGRAFLGVVHRLDRPVSGVVVFARTSKAAARLSAQFAARQAHKTYWGLCTRGSSADSGTLRQFLRKDRSANRVHVVSAGAEDAREALTEWRQLEQQGGRTLFEFRPRTGRSHQLRLAALTLAGPLLGDLRYGARTPLIDKSIGLHAYSLALEHPTKKVSVVFATPPPELDVWDMPTCRQARECGDVAGPVEGS